MSSRRGNVPVVTVRRLKVAWRWNDDPVFIEGRYVGSYAMEQGTQKMYVCGEVTSLKHKLLLIFPEGRVYSLLRTTRQNRWRGS